MLHLFLLSVGRKANQITTVRNVSSKLFWQHYNNNTIFHFPLQKKKLIKFTFTERKFTVVIVFPLESLAVIECVQLYLNNKRHRNLITGLYSAFYIPNKKPVCHLVSLCLSGRSITSKCSRRRSRGRRKLRTKLRCWSRS